MKTKEKRNRQTIRFLKWIRKYPGWWFLICTPDEGHMNPSMMKMLIKRLAKKQLYEIIFVLLMVHRNADFMDSVLKTLLLELVIAEWEGKGTEKKQILHALTGLLT